MNTFSIGDMIRFGWETFKKRPGLFVGALIVCAIISGIISGIVGHIAPGTANSPSLVGFLANLVVNTFIGIGFTSFALRAHDNVAELNLADLWRPQFFLYYLMTTILVYLVCGIGFILLIIPGIIAALALCFSHYLIVDRGMTPIAAMKESARITKGSRLNILGLGLVLAVLNLLGLICLIVGLFVTIPVSMLAIVHTYRTLAGAADAIVVA